MKNAPLPPVFFMDSNSPCQDLLFQHSHKPRKNTLVLVGIGVKKPESISDHPEMRRTYAQ